MKSLKKISLLLCACFTFSSIATSCQLFGGDNSSSSSKPNNSSTQGNSSSTNPDDSSVEEDTTSAIIDVYMGLITRTLEKSQSAKLTFALETTTTASATDGAGTIGGWTNYLLEGEAIVAKTEDGFDAEFSVQIPSEDTPGTTEKQSYYYIDGYVYTYNKVENVYEKSNETLEDTLNNLVHSTTGGEYSLDTLLGLVAGGAGGIFGEDMSDLSYDKLEEAFSEYGVMESEITDTGMKITADATEEADELFDFLRTVDKDTTYADLLDFALGQISPDYTCADILDNLDSRGKDTVNMLVEDLDRVCKEETGKSLQENLDNLLKTDAVKELINSLFEGENAEIAEGLLSFNIQKFLKQESSVEDGKGGYIPYGELTLNDLAKQLVKKLTEALGDEGNEVLGDLGLLTDNVNWRLLIGAVEMVLDWKAFEDIPEDSEFYELLDKAQALEVSQADMEFELKANKAAIESFTILGNFDGNASDDGITATVGATLNLVISEFNTEKMTISLPKGAEVVIVYNECVGCGETKENVSYRETELDYYCDECFGLLETPDDGVEA